MAIHRVTATWSGFQGGPGYTNLFFTGDGSGEEFNTNRARVQSFFNEMNELMPLDVEVLIEPEVAVIDEVTGMVQSYLNSGTSPSPSTGGSSSGYSAASGAVIQWLTAGVRNGRRVSGRTFLVPLGNVAYEDNGTLAQATIQTLSAAAEELVGTGFDSGFGIWSRPTNGDGGEFWEVNSFRIPDMAAVLRSRRD